jgi:ankyrin repeat protein
MSEHNQLLYDIEVHSLEGIRNYFETGGDPNEVHNGVPIFTTMVEMYLRSPRFKQAIRLFIDYGLRFEDKALLAVLSDDTEFLENQLEADPSIVSRTFSTFNNAFTPLKGGTLLHYCAEYNHVACAKVLVKWDADINATAALDATGFGGHTPIFHTVCQNLNNSQDMLDYLLQLQADLTITVKGLFWGKGYEWETFIPAVNPLSYAMMGLLPQMHREEKTIAKVVSQLVQQAYSIDLTLPNIPNRYLAG